MQSPPFLRYLVPPRFKYSPQHYVLKHPRLPFLQQCQRRSFTASVEYFERKIQLSGFSAYPEGSPSQLFRITGVLLYFSFPPYVLYFWLLCTSLSYLITLLPSHQRVTKLEITFIELLPICCYIQSSAQCPGYELKEAGFESR